MQIYNIYNNVEVTIRLSNKDQHGIVLQSSHSYFGFKRRETDDNKTKDFSHIVAFNICGLRPSNYAYICGSLVSIPLPTINR
jgi:hypothetical protein